MASTTLCPNAFFARAATMSWLVTMPIGRGGVDHDERSDALGAHQRRHLGHGD